MKNDFGRDVFVHDRLAGTTSLVSRTPGSAVATGDGQSEPPVISAARGRSPSRAGPPTWWRVSSTPTGTYDMLLYERVAGTTTLISRAGRRGTPASRTAASDADGASDAPQAMPTGRSSCSAATRRI